MKQGIRSFPSSAFPEAKSGRMRSGETSASRSILQCFAIGVADVLKAHRATPAPFRCSHPGLCPSASPFPSPRRVLLLSSAEKCRLGWGFSIKPCKPSSSKLLPTGDETQLPGQRRLCVTPGKALRVGSVLFLDRSAVFMQAGMWGVIRTSSQVLDEHVFHSRC